MVFVKKICPPERRKAAIAVSIRPSSSKLAVHDTTRNYREGIFQVRIALCITETTRPGEAITICTNDSAFAPSNPDGELDVPAQGTISLKSTAETARHIDLGMFKTHHAQAGPYLFLQTSKIDVRHTYSQSRRKGKL